MKLNKFYSTVTAIILLCCNVVTNDAKGFQDSLGVNGNSALAPTGHASSFNEVFNADAGSQQQQAQYSFAPPPSPLPRDYDSSSSTYPTQVTTNPAVDNLATLKFGHPCDNCQTMENCNCDQASRIAQGPDQFAHSYHPPIEQAPGAVKSILGVNEFVHRQHGYETRFKHSQLVPWEMFAYGEYVGPHRTPHVPDYRLRVNDQLEFVYFLSRRQSATPYQIYVGDTITITSATDETISQQRLQVLSDGMISLPLIGQVRAAGKTISDLQAELNKLYEKFLTDPSILVQVIDSDTPLRDILDSVDARGGVGGRLRQATVSPDGTVQLPAVGSVPAVGLTLDEIRREVNSRYNMTVKGLEVTPVLVTPAPRFAYVVGQVATPGRFQLVGPTTVMQAIALAEGDLAGANLRNIVVFRRDEAWRLTATRLDLSGAIHGRRPFPADDIYLRDSDIVLLPRKPIQRISEAVNLYLTQTLYAAVPQEVIFQDVFSDVFNGAVVTP